MDLMGQLIEAHSRWVIVFKYMILKPHFIRSNTAQHGSVNNERYAPYIDMIRRSIEAGFAVPWSSFCHYGYARNTDVHMLIGDVRSSSYLYSFSNSLPAHCFLDKEREGED